jgi:hypothetical protein
MGRLGDKLGPLLFQFPYFNKAKFPDPKPFIDRLERFLPALPREMRFAVEVRNKTFVTPALLDLLRQHRVALAFIDHPWFFGIDDLFKKGNVLTTVSPTSAGSETAKESRKGRGAGIISSSTARATWGAGFPTFGG